MTEKRERKTITGCRGFTLMETMVATMVLGIALVAIMELFSGGLRSARLAEDHTRAVLLAGSKLEEILLTIPLAENILEGSFDDQFNWSCTIMPEEEEIITTESQPLLQAFHIQLTVNWRNGNKNRDFSLSTIRITKPQTEEESI